VTSSVHHAREALGQRLRDIRKNAGLSGVALAARAGWTNSSKVSKIEHGKQTPPEDDIRAYVEWRRLLIPGILHTAEYAKAVMRRVIDFYRIPDDLEAGVATRMERQQILYRGGRRFHFIVAHQALLTTVGTTEVMIGQLDRLLAVMSLSRVKFGILPTGAEYRVPTKPHQHRCTPSRRYLLVTSAEGRHHM
jgi:transcriptional regulator with XRE-family HTH domain